MRTLFFIQFFLLTCFSLELNGKCTDKQISDCYKDFERHIGHTKVCGRIAKDTEVCLKDLQRDFKCPLSDKIDAVQVEMRLCKRGFHSIHQCPGHYTCWSNKISECRRQYKAHRDDEGACSHGDKYTIRPMRAADLTGLHALLAENQWNMELAYLDAVFSTDPSGLIVVIGNDGTFLGHTAILSHGPYLASAGMNIMKEGYRELGIGRKLFRSVMEAMGDRNVGGTALSNRITFYNQFGWTIPSFTIEYNQGPISHEFLQHCKQSHHSDVEIVPTKELKFDDIVNYDAGLHTVPRKRYLYNWLFHETAHSFTAIQNGRITGYCVIRPADVGWKLQPLYADTEHVAQALFKHAADQVPAGSDLILTTPVENEHAATFVKGNKMKTYLSMTRLYNKWDVHVDIGRVFSVSSTEFGIV